MLEKILSPNGESEKSPSSTKRWIWGEGTKIAIDIKQKELVLEVRNPKIEDKTT